MIRAVPANAMAGYTAPGLYIARATKLEAIA